MMNLTSDQIEQQKQVQMQQVMAATQNPIVPKIYANGLIVGRSLSDLFVMLSNMGNPVGIITMSFTTAKTLEENLHRTLRELEGLLKCEFPTMDEVQGKLQEQGEPER